MIRMKFQARLLLTASLLTALLPCHTLAAPISTPLDLNLPSLGATVGSELSPSDERALGAHIMTQVRADPTFMTDPETTEYLNRLGYQLVSQAKTYTYQFFFFPIRDSSLNAFALPGGYIAVHSGTIIAAKSESELAGVMGHEIGHVSQRHIARMIEGQKNNLAVSLGSVLLAILAARAGGNSGGHAAAAIAMGSQAAMIQNQLNFSQEAEREADRIGLQTLSNAGFAPDGMLNFFKRLQSNNRFYESAAPAYLSTHPLTIARMADIENRIRDFPPKMHRDSLDFRLIQMRLKVLQETSHDRWFQIEKEMQRSLENSSGQEKAIFHYGLSVVSAKLHHPQDAYRHAQLAMSAGSSAFLEKNLIRTLYDVSRQEKNPTGQKQALNRAEKSLDKYPLSSLIAENYIDLLYEEGQHQKLINHLRNGSAISPANPNYHALMARSYEALGKQSLQYFHTGEMYALMGATEAALYQMDLAERANDGDFYTMSEIDARRRTLRDQFLMEKERGLSQKK